MIIAEPKINTIKRRIFSTFALLLNAENTDQSFAVGLS
jgi:hypothetical protein